MSSLKPLKLFHRGGSPNPWKVLIVIEELGLPYELVRVDDVKSKEFLAINPNGRVPALQDPNTNITTWESGSNIDYLVETYDKDHSISHSDPPDKFITRNWAHFQMSGQGPYFGQKAWFSNVSIYGYSRCPPRPYLYPRNLLINLQYHPEKVQSAIDRYANEIERVLCVIELHLQSSGQSYLVGDKVTYADLMWLPWNDLLPFLLGKEFDLKTRFPRTYTWYKSLSARDGVKRAAAAKTEALKSNS